MINVQFAQLRGLEGYYTNIGVERLTINKNLEPKKVKKLIEKIDKNRPAHSQPVSA